MLRLQSKAKLDALDQAGGVARQGVEFVCGVVVHEAKGNLDGLRVQKIASCGQGDPRDSAGGGGEGAEGAREELNVFSRSDVGRVRGPHLVVERADELIVHRVRDLIHGGEQVLVSYMYVCVKAGSRFLRMRVCARKWCIIVSSVISGLIKRRLKFTHGAFIPLSGSGSKQRSPLSAKSWLESQFHLVVGAVQWSRGHRSTHTSAR